MGKESGEAQLFSHFSLTQPSIHTKPWISGNISEDSQELTYAAAAAATLELLKNLL
jgi:hypothetical protein